MRCRIMGSLLIAACATVGCTGKSPTNQSTASPGQPAGMPTGTYAAPQQPLAVPGNASPDYVVTVFLNALRSGDSPTTESLLTSKARQELARHSLSVDVQALRMPLIKCGRPKY